MPNIPRKHHYLSKFYLKQFANEKDQLVCINLRTQKTFLSNYAKVCCETDFNQITLPGFDPNELESQLSNVETRAARAICDIERTGVFTGENKTIVLNLIALYAIRTPKMRKIYEQMLNTVCQRLLEEIAASEGNMINGVLVTKEQAEFIKKKQYQIFVPRNDHIQRELKALDSVICMLFKRRWSLIHAPSRSFITSDAPVSIVSKREQNHQELLGLNTPNSLVIFPLTPQLALIGDFEGTEGTFIATEKMIADINTSIFTNAIEKIFSSKKNFYFYNEERAVKDDLVSLMKTAVTLLEMVES